MLVEAVYQQAVRENESGNLFLKHLRAILPEQGTQSGESVGAKEVDEEEELNPVCEHLTQSLGDPERLHSPSTSHDRLRAVPTTLLAF